MEGFLGKELEVLMEEEVEIDGRRSTQKSLFLKKGLKTSAWKRLQKYLFDAILFIRIGRYLLCNFSQTATCNSL